VILPFTLLRRLECVLAETKDAVVAKYDELKPAHCRKMPKRSFCCAPAGFLLQYLEDGSGKMGQNDIKANLESYVQAFSPMRVKSSNTSNSASLSACWKMPTCCSKW
jgi:type I restriction enzyme M protein